MIKRILLASIMMLTVTLSANNIKTSADSVKATIEQVLPDSAQVTFKEVYNDIKAGLTGLASGLKVGTEHVYGILVKQQIVNAVVYIPFILLGFILFIYFFLCFKSKSRFKVSRSWHSKEEKYIYVTDEAEWSESHIAKVIIIGLLSLVFTLVGLLNIDTVLVGLINPEYGAIREILTFIK